ncbi:MAG: hypothetical protein WCG76_11060, partial [Verrucomicrobiota bacterium]
SAQTGGTPVHPDQLQSPMISERWYKFGGSSRRSRSALQRNDWGKMPPVCIVLAAGFLPAKK